MARRGCKPRLAARCSLSLARSLSLACSLSTEGARAGGSRPAQQSAEAAARACQLGSRVAGRRGGAGLNESGPVAPPTRLRGERGMRTRHLISPRSAPGLGTYQHPARRVYPGGGRWGSSASQYTRATPAYMNTHFEMPGQRDPTTRRAPESGRQTPRPPLPIRPGKQACPPPCWATTWKAKPAMWAPITPGAPLIWTGES